MKPSPSEELAKLLPKLLSDLPIQPRKLSQEIGKPYSTLMREVNPMDSSAKLGVLTMFEIMLITGDTSPLEFMAEAMGYHLTPA